MQSKEYKLMTELTDPTGSVLLTLSPHCLFDDIKLSH